MDDAAIPVLSLELPENRFAADIGESFRRFGFAMVCDHGIHTDLIADGWELLRRFFALPEAEKLRYHVPGIAGARGYTPFGTEIAKDGKFHDLKEFWHVGRELPSGHPLQAAMPDNIWPESPAGFREVFSRLFAEFDRVGSLLLSRIALDLELDRDWFAPAIADGNSVLRLLHYPPIQPEQGASGAIRAAAHQDINLITLLLGADEAGLELLDREGNWRSLAPPEGALVVNIADMLQRLTNHVLPSTTHRVVNPSGDPALRSRYAMPFFVHLRSDYPLSTLPGCVTAENPDRNPDAITADEYLQERLIEIGLRS